MSGLLGSILGGLLGGGGTAQAGAAQTGTSQAGALESGAGNLLIQVINAAGGPAGILQKFEQAGLGEKAASWIGTGANQPISPEQVTQVFPANQIDQWAQQHGLPGGVATQILAQLLPHAVDATTPTGTAPPPGTTVSPGSIDFGSLLGRLAGEK